MSFTPRKHLFWAHGSGYSACGPIVAMFILTPLGMERLANMGAFLLRLSAFLLLLHDLNVSWLTGGLSRQALKEVCPYANISRFFDTPIPAETGGPKRSALEERCTIRAWHPRHGIISLAHHSDSARHKTSTLGSHQRRAAHMATPSKSRYTVATKQYRSSDSFWKSISMRKSIWALSGLRLVCHCLLGQDCDGGVLIDEYRRQFSDAYDRDDLQSKPPSAAVLNYMARLREEAESSDGSSAGEGAPAKHSGWRGKGSPMQVGVGYTTREICDGQGPSLSWPLGSSRQEVSHRLELGTCCSHAHGLCTETRKA